MKVLLLELIDVTRDLVDLLIEKGKLPTFARLKREGMCVAPSNFTASAASPLKQYRARKQAVVSLGSRLLTRAVLCRCPNKGEIRQW